MKILNILKSATGIVTIFIPQTILVKIASTLMIMGAEHLVKNTKTNFDNEALEKIKNLLKESREQKNV